MWHADARIFDGTPLQKQLIAAYVPGIRFSDEDFKSLKKWTLR